MADKLYLITLMILSDYLGDMDAESNHLFKMFDF